MLVAAGVAQGRSVMNVESTKSGCILALGALLLLAGAPSIAQKKPGAGGGTDPCLATNLDFPAYIYGVTISSSRGSEVEIRIADANGRCSRPLGRTPGVERRPLLISLGGGAWRAVWPDGNGYDNASDGIVVQDFTVGPQASVSPAGSGRMTAGRTTGLEAAGGGSFLFQTVDNGDLPSSLWLAVVNTTTDPAQRTVTATRLTGAANCQWYDIAVGPDGDSVYLVTGRTDGARGDVIRQVRLTDLASAGDLGNLGCGNQVLETLGGHTVQLAAGTCPGGSGTCLALERHNARGIPCTPDYYRTDVFALGTGLSTTLQLAYPSWGALGALYGRQTGSTSKNACTAKIYTTILRHLLAADLTSGSATTLGTATSIDAPNPMP